MTTTAVTASTARRLTFQPAAGHPGGKYARPASLPAGTPVTIEETGGGLLLRADVDGPQDYELHTTAKDLAHPQWCQQDAHDPTSGDLIHYSQTHDETRPSYRITATLTDDGTGPRVILDASADAATLEELDALIGHLQQIRNGYQSTTTRTDVA